MPHQVQRARFLPDPLLPVRLETLRVHFTRWETSPAQPYGDKSEYDQAIADYGRAIDLAPDLAEAYPYYGRGLVHKMRGGKEEAIRDFERFLEWSEDEYQRKEAEKHLRELLKLSAICTISRETDDVYTLSGL